MNFQQLKGDNSIVQSRFEDFCICSKPYDFCSIKNPSVRMVQIKKYYEYLLRECNIFYVLENQEVVFFIAISEYDDRIEMQFVFSGTFDLIKNAKAFREFYWKQFNCSTPFVGVVKRHHKLKTYLNYIKKRDRDAKISLDNDEILVSYNRDGI
jgi:hypothetical protein